MKFRIGSHLLFLKLVSSFVLFGMLVGYLSFLSGTVIETYQLYKSFKEGFNSELRSRLHSDEPDVLYQAFVDEPLLGEAIIQNLGTLIKTQKEGDIELALYARHPTSNIWTFLAALNRPEDAASINSKIIADLNEVIDRGYFYEPDVYLGKSDLKVLYIEMTQEKDTLDYILQLTFKRDGLGNFIEKEKSTFYSFTTIVLIFSLILGSIFAKSISKPIHILTDKALDLSKGNLGIRFHSKRIDDIGTLTHSMDKMSLNLFHRFNSMQTMNKIDRAVLSSVSRNELLGKVAGFISEQFDNTSVTVLEHKEEGLVISALVPEREHTIGRLIFESDLPEELKNITETNVFDLEILKSNAYRPVILFPEGYIKKMGVFIPILHDEKPVAIFAITLEKVNEQDLEALQMLADQMGVALRSKIEMEQRENQSHGTLIALTRSVDAKSRWTAGHSERVANLSVALASKMGIKGDELQTVRISALLHDIGKLGIPEAILDKPGKLTDIEFNHIKSHPEKGDNIIKDIPGMEEVRKGVRHHHERWDGSGYPDKLKGDEIPRIARIITVADVCDAISEDRPYRDGFSKEEVYKFFMEQRGLLFDPDLLDIFLELISSPDSPL